MVAYSQTIIPFLGEKEEDANFYRPVLTLKHAGRRGA